MEKDGQGQHFIDGQPVSEYAYLLHITWREQAVREHQEIMRFLLTILIAFCVGFLASSGFAAWASIYFPVGCVCQKQK